MLKTIIDVMEKHIMESYINYRWYHRKGIPVFYATDVKSKKYFLVLIKRIILFKSKQQQCLTILLNRNIPFLNIRKFTTSSNLSDFIRFISISFVWTTFSLMPSIGLYGYHVKGRCSSTQVDLNREPFLKGKTQYDWSPCSYYFRSPSFCIENNIYLNWPNQLP